jgi:hypothetical protein
MYPAKVLSELLPGFSLNTATLISLVLTDTDNRLRRAKKCLTKGRFTDEFSLGGRQGDQPRALLATCNTGSEGRPNEPT